jgi:hypothetical protein
MATIAAVQPGQNNGPFLVGATPLTGTDTLVYKPAVNQVLYMFNTTASPVTVTIDGDAGTTISPGGYGGTISVAAGKAIAVAAGTVQAVQLRSISAFLQGTVAVTGGVAGVVAWIAEG